MPLRPRVLPEVCGSSFCHRYLLKVLFSGAPAVASKPKQIDMKVRVGEFEPQCGLALNVKNDPQACKRLFFFTFSISLFFFLTCISLSSHSYRYVCLAVALLSEFDAGGTDAVALIAFDVADSADCKKSVCVFTLSRSS